MPTGCPRCYSAVPDGATQCPHCDFPHAFEPVKNGVVRTMPNPIAKGIVVHRELAADHAEMQRLSLFFEKLFAFPGMGTLMPGVDGAEIESTLAFLAERQVVDRIKIGMPIPFDIGYIDQQGRHSLKSSHDRATSELYIDGPTALRFFTTPGTPHSEVMRRFANYRGTFRDAPIAVHLPGLRDATTADTSASVVEVTLRNIPLPPENTPWEDIIAFRSEAETQRQFRELRQWMRDRLASGTPPDELQEEIDAKLSEFRTFMRGSQMAGRIGILKAVIYTGVDISMLSHGLPPVFTTTDYLFERIERGVPQVANDRLAPGREIAYLDSVKTRFAD